MPGFFALRVWPAQQAAAALRFLVKNDAGRLLTSVPANIITKATDRPFVHCSLNMGTASVLANTGTSAIKPPILVAPRICTARAYKTI